MKSIASKIMRHSEFVMEQTTCTMHIVLHRNGDPIHFDVTVDFQRVAEKLGAKAESNHSHESVVADGFVKVNYIG